MITWGDFKKLVKEIDETENGQYGNIDNVPMQIDFIDNVDSIEIELHKYLDHLYFTIKIGEE